MRTGKKMKINVLVLLTLMTAICAAQDKVATDGKATLQLSCLTEFSDLAIGLSEQYQLEHPGVKINVATIPEGSINESLTSGGMVLVNKACLPAITQGQGLKMVVGRNVIVPIINNNNPHKELISQIGISPRQFASIYSPDERVTWGQLLGTNDKRLVEAFVPAASFAKAYLADFMGTGSEEIFATEIGKPEEMIRKIEASPNAIGFCTLACLAEMEQNGLNAGISLVPIDMDGDGTLEHFENIYGSYAELSHGIFVGKYPRDLYSKVYAITGQNPATEAETAFLDWVINGGQESLISAGILTIDYGERASGLRQLYPASKVIADVPVKATTGRTMHFLIPAFVMLALLLWLVSGRFGKSQTAKGKKRSAEPGLIGANAAGFPAGLFYDRSHTWAIMEMTGHVRVGIDDFIQRVTGSVTRVMMKSPGDKIKRGETLFTLVQQGKQLEIKSPVSGVVVQYNESLLEDASLLNSDPYTDGWIYTVEPVNWMAEMKSFFLGEPYGVWLKAEFTRLKDFFANGIEIKVSQKMVPVLQDGGEIREGALEDFGPEVWEEFQTRFINHK